MNDLGAYHEGPMTMPNFLVIGAMKCATGAMSVYLKQHPEVFFKKNTRHYFAFGGERPRHGGPPSALDRPITDRTEYERLFEGADGHRAIGEGSWSSIYHPGTAERIRREIPDARIVAIVRQPAERAWSGYLHLRLYGREPARTFEEALALEPQRLHEGWAMPWLYRDVGLYGRQLARYYDVFPADRIRVYLQEDLGRDPVAVMKDAYAFLGVDPSFTPDTSLRPNASGAPRGGLVGVAARVSRPARRLARAVLPRLFHRRLRSAVVRRSTERRRLDPAARARLTEGFAEDIDLLARLIGRDLSHWTHASV